MSRSRSKSISVHEQVQFLLRSRSTSQSRSSSWSIPGPGPSLFQDKLNDFYGVVLGLSLAILIISELFLQKKFWAHRDDFLGKNCRPNLFELCIIGSG